MKRSEAFWILNEMYELANEAQKQALNIAQRDIEFVDLMPDVPVQRWIPVTERLPEKPGYYLTWWHGHSCPEGMSDVLNFDGTVFPWETLFPSCKNTVTHWMPLPEPPKEDAE